MATTNEPVAWMNPETLECGHGGNVDWEDTGCIPLYTHPVKELTDELNQLLYSVNGDAYLGKDKEEELVKIVRKQYTKPVKELTDEEILKLTCEHGLDGELMVFNDFAKAILRKASEK